MNVMFYCSYACCLLVHFVSSYYVHIPQFFAAGYHNKQECMIIKEEKRKRTSMPVIRTGVYPHMPIAITTVVKDTFWQCIK